MAGTIVSNCLTLVGATWIGVEENLLTIAAVERSTERRRGPKKVEVALGACYGASATIHQKLHADGYFAGLVPQAAGRTVSQLVSPTVF